MVADECLQEERILPSSRMYLVFMVTPKERRKIDINAGVGGSGLFHIVYTQTHIH